MEMFIEDRNGKKYEIIRSRKTIVVADNIKKGLDSSENGALLLENAGFEILKTNYPELTIEEYDDILEYNYSILGNDYLILLGAISEYVFTGPETKKVETTKYPFLGKFVKKAKEMEQKL